MTSRLFLTAIVFFGITLLPGNLLLANLTVGSNTINYLVEDVLSDQTMVISNIQYTGDNNAIGYFDGSASNIGIDEGVLISTGDISDAPGPNDMASASTGYYTSGDADLDALINDVTSDAAVLEFEVVANSLEIQFNYVFASEEYLEFANSTFNDVFAFYYWEVGSPATKKNIALIPGTALPVSINNINDVNNPAFYVDNGDGFLTGGPTVQFDGFTVKLSAIAQVECGKKYHFKLAIADVGDSSYDSCIFLEGQSLTSNNIVLDATPLNLNGGFVNDSTILENGGYVEFCVTRQADQSDQDKTVSVNFSGSANISDVTPVPSEITLLKGETKKCFVIETIVDDEKECTENFELQIIDNSNVCQSADIGRKRLYIVDECDTLLYFAPNSFSPNGDGINDEFFISFSDTEQLVSYELKIFNRWGDIVFVTEDATKTWRGEQPQGAAPMGVYIYKAVLKDVRKQEEEVKMGHVTVIR